MEGMHDFKPSLPVWIKPPQKAHWTSSPDSLRARTSKRAPDFYRIRIGENDRRIISLVHDYRLLSQAQIQVLMGHARSTTQRLLRRLYDHGYLERVFLPIRVLGSNSPYYYYILDKNGIELLRNQGCTQLIQPPTKSPSPYFLEHTNAINNFRLTVQLAAQAEDWQIGRWLTEKEIKADYDRVTVSGKSKKVPVVPDGYFNLTGAAQVNGHFFLELDRGTMKLKLFQEKVEAYVAYYKSGEYARRYGADGFRVLTVVSGVGRNRVDHLAEISAKVPGIGRRFWFTHLDQVTPRSFALDPIWKIAGDQRLQALFGEKQ